MKGWASDCHSKAVMVCSLCSEKWKAISERQKLELQEQWPGQVCSLASSVGAHAVHLVCAYVRPQFVEVIQPLAAHHSIECVAHLEDLIQMARDCRFHSHWSPSSSVKNWRLHCDSVAPVLLGGGPVPCQHLNGLGRGVERSLEDHAPGHRLLSAAHFDVQCRWIREVAEGVAGMRIRSWCWHPKCLSTVPWASVSDGKWGKDERN